MRASQSRILWAVLVINATMFFVEIISGILANSVSLVGDSLDMFGDAVAYGSSLFVLNLDNSAKARSAMLKSAIMFITAIAVLIRAIYKTVYPAVPEVELMSSVGFIVLSANLICLLLLTKHRADDVNMSSIWICSRNDIIANVSVLAAAALVFFSASNWPDLIVGFGITLLFASSAAKVYVRARQELP